MINVRALFIATAVVGACDQNPSPNSTRPAGALRPAGKFVLDVNPSEGSAQLRVLKQGVYQELTFGEGLGPNANPPGTIQAETLTADLPGENGCAADTNCFVVRLTNFTGANQLGVFMGIDAIFPPTGRALIGSDGTPAGVTAPLGGRMFGDLADGAASADLAVDITLPSGDLSPYQVVGTFWGDDGSVGNPLPLVGVDSMDGGEPTMTPRFFRSGTPGDPCSVFSSGAFQFRSYPFTTGTDPNLTATFDPGTCGTNVFVTFHVAPFDPNDICGSFVFTHGSSQAFTETFAAPPNTDMLMVVNGVANAPGVVCGPYSFNVVGAP